MTEPSASNKGKALGRDIRNLREDIVAMEPATIAADEAKYGKKFSEALQTVEHTNVVPGMTKFLLTANTSAFHQLKACLTLACADHGEYSDDEDEGDRKKKEAGEEDSDDLYDEEAEEDKPAPSTGGGTGGSRKAHRNAAKKQAKKEAKARAKASAKGKGKGREVVQPTTTTAAAAMAGAGAVDEHAAAVMTAAAKKLSFVNRRLRHLANANAVMATCRATYTSAPADRLALDNMERLMLGEWRKLLDTRAELGRPLGPGEQDFALPEPVTATTTVVAAAAGSAPASASVAAQKGAEGQGEEGEEEEEDVEEEEEEEEEEYQGTSPVSEEE